MQGLGRIPEFDERSRSYPIRKLLDAAGLKIPRSYTWACVSRLDQGDEPECVGFAWAHELAARPVRVAVDHETGRHIYRAAQKLDQWPGEGYEGTSVLGGAKAVDQMGYISEYRWAFGLEDLILAVGYAGPAIIGINWYTGMYETAACGHVHPTGRIDGGHAVLLRGVSMAEERFLLHNSWGPAWGDRGTAWLAFGDAARLLAEDGEACIPIKRLDPHDESVEDKLATAGIDPATVTIS